MLRAREHFEVTQQEARAVLGREMPRVHAQLKRLLDTEALTVQLRSGQKFDQVRGAAMHRLTHRPQPPAAAAAHAPAQAHARRNGMGSSS